MFPKYVPVPHILYIYTLEKIYMLSFTYIYFYIYKHIKNAGNEGERGTLKVETYPLLQISPVQIRPNSCEYTRNSWQNR